MPPFSFGKIRLGYPIELDNNNDEYYVIGYESRSYVWIMSRKPVVEKETYKMLKERLVEKHQYSLDGLRKVPQLWTREERKKQNLEKEIGNEFLVD